MATQYAFYLDTDYCSGCRCCVMACKDKNDLPIGIKYRKVYDYAGGSWENQDGVMIPNQVYNYSVSVSCMHCANPACMAACPTGAIRKREDGIVYIDARVCDGCGNCVAACPYQAPRMLEDGTAGKCDMCREYVDAGKNPACVDACQMRCLKFGELSALQAEYGTNADIAPLPDSSLTSPSIVINLNRQITDSMPEGMITNPEEEL